MIAVLPYEADTESVYKKNLHQTQFCLIGYIEKTKVTDKMFIRIVWMVKLLVICQFIGRSRQSDPIPPNPCPDLFQYYEGDDGEIYGELELPAIREDVTNITVIMSIRGPISVSIQIFVGFVVRFI